MGRTSAGGFHSLVLPGLVLLLMAAVVVEAGHLSHPSVRGPHVSDAAESAEVQRQMAAMITHMDVGLITPKTLSAVRCNKTATKPPDLPDNQFDRFNCFATYTSGQRQPWCVAYDPAETSLITDYQGPKACEGPSSGIIRP